jgi:hypothetical protein
MEIIIIIIIILVICCCCCILGGGGYYYINYVAPTSVSNNTSAPSSSNNTSAPASITSTTYASSTTPASITSTTSAPTNPKVCNTNPQALLGNRSCNSWSWDDERTLQRYNMPNYKQTRTVPPAWDCWYEPTTQCVSREYLNSSNPTKDCPKRNTF